MNKCKRTDAGIIIHHKDRVLLQLRDNNPNIEYPLTWVLLGGGIQKNETPKQAIRRELKEEIGYDLSVYKFFKKYHFENRVKQFIFSANIVIDVNKTILREGRKIRYFSRKELENLDFGFNIKQVIAEFLQQQTNQSGS